jgi:hypothetical protein
MLRDIWSSYESFIMFWIILVTITKQELNFSPQLNLTKETKQFLSI